MATISVSLPSDGTTADVSDYNTPLTTITTEINGNLDNANIKANAAISTSKLAADGGLGATHLSTSAITLGYAQKADANYVAASNAAADVPGLTVAVTAPAGGRRVKVTFCGNTYLGTAAGQITVRIMEGTAILATAKKQHAATSQPDNCTYSCILTPTAGAHTYKIQMTSTAGIPSLEIAATQPAYILVEAI